MFCTLLPAAMPRQQPGGTWLWIICSTDVSTWRKHWAAKWSHERAWSETGGYSLWLSNTSHTSLPPPGGELLCSICVCAWRVGVWVSKFECLPSPPRCLSTHTQLVLCRQWQNKLMNHIWKPLTYVLSCKFSVATWFVRHIAMLNIIYST